MATMTCREEAQRSGLEWEGQWFRMESMWGCCKRTLRNFRKEMLVEYGEISPFLTPNFTICVFLFKIILDRVIHLINEKSQLLTYFQLSSF